MSKDRKHMFAKEYLIDLNATQAAKRAGYSEKTAYRTGCDLLKIPQVAKAIQIEMDKRGAAIGITAERVLTELGKIAFTDVRSIFKDGSLIRVDELSDEAAASLAGCEIVTRNLGEGEVEYVAKMRMADRLKALELCGRHLGMFVDKLQIEDEPMPTKIEISVQDARKPKVEK